ncbi:hypothetical protein CBR_g36893 [Chara braunii]|uniref:Uncharacterized protein n=1 Tax=Chara braunii TaxID=69332 RepID=A0A388LLS8_CHABU|nr:hypothetical protein CBR_g36893 [Chara braunii]|eukprot:GBG83278.1 hypothetical protein CBR_g36893 [Chara braunii]
MSWSRCMFIDLFGPESNFHTGLIQRNPVATEDGVGSGEEEDLEDDSLTLTEEEKAYHAKLLEEGRLDRVKAIAANQKTCVNKYVRNAFLPTVPSRWVEAQSRSVDDKLWDLYTFNYVAPIHADSYRFLASLTGEKMKKCREKALTENTELIKGNYPLTPDAIKLPVIGGFDRTKCGVSASALAVRGFLGPKVQTVIVELKRIWNVGCPYLKCQCVAEGKGDCGKNISWFDHVFWYLLSDLFYLFPEASSLRARARAFRVRARSIWRAVVLSMVVFTHMRDVMVKMAFSVTMDPSRTAQDIIDDPAIMLHKFPRTMAKLILPARYVRTAQKRALEAAPASSAKKARTAQQSILEFYVPPSRAGTSVSSQDQSAPSSASTPPSSSIIVQEDGQASACNRPLRRSPRGLGLVRASLFKN